MTSITTTTPHSLSPITILVTVVRSSIHPRRTNIRSSYRHARSQLHSNRRPTSKRGILLLRYVHTQDLSQIRLMVGWVDQGPRPGSGSASSEVKVTFAYSLHTSRSFVVMQLISFARVCTRSHSRSHSRSPSHSHSHSHSHSCVIESSTTGRSLV